MKAAVVAIIGRAQMEPLVSDLLCRGNSDRRLRCFTRLTDVIWGGMISAHAGNDSEGRPSLPIPELTMGIVVVCADSLQEALRYQPDWVISYSGRNGNKRFTVKQDPLGCPLQLAKGYREIVVHEYALGADVIKTVANNIVGLIHDAGERSLQPGEYRAPVPWVRLRQQRHALRHA